MTLACANVRAADPSPSILPLQRVRLYDSGVAYFERAGIPRAGELTLPVPSAHLDDALKTIVVLSDDPKAKVERIEFTSAVSRELGEALSGLPDESESLQLLSQVAGALRGVEVEVAVHGARERGRVLGVETLPMAKFSRKETDEVPATEPSPEDRRALLLLSNAGSLRRIALDDLGSIRILEPHRVRRLQAALDAMSTSTKPRMLRLITSGQRVRLGYVAQAPVWRASYRLVLDAAKPSSITGWALVHNDTDEDWVGIRLELVNGKPSSFLLPMAAPRYTERDTMPLDEDLQTVPQLLDVTVDGMQTSSAWGKGEGIGLGAIGGVGYGQGRLGGSHRAASPRVVLGNLADTPIAEGAEAGSLFLYTPSTPLTLGARRSAMVPFLDATVSARPIAWLDKPETAAQRAVLLENTTRQTLPPGTLAVLADNGFAGEAPLDRLKPSERRLVPIGADLDVEIHELARTSRSFPKIVEVSTSTLVEHYVQRQSMRYEIVNKSGSARTVVLELHAISNARIQGADKVGFDDVRRNPYAMFDVPARQRVVRSVVLEEGLQRNHARSVLTAHILQRLAASIRDETTRNKLLRASKALASTEAIRTRLARVETALQETLEDLASLRLSMQVLYGKIGGQEIAARIARAESRASRLRADRATLLARGVASEQRAWNVLGGGR